MIKAGAHGNPDAVDSFTIYATGRKTVQEYRFGGLLGFGGKVYLRGRADGWKVYCYPENLNSTTREVIERTNAALAKIGLPEADAVHAVAVSDETVEAMNDASAKAQGEVNRKLARVMSAAASTLRDKCDYYHPGVGMKCGGKRFNHDINYPEHPFTESVATPSNIDAAIIEARQERHAAAPVDEVKPPAMTVRLDKRSRLTIIAALGVYYDSLYSGDQAGRQRGADAQYIQDTLIDAEQIVITEVEELNATNAEMLEALKDCAKRMERCHIVQQERSGGEWKMLDTSNARAVIAKAEKERANG